MHFHFDHNTPKFLSFYQNFVRNTTRYVGGVVSSSSISSLTETFYFEITVEVTNVLCDCFDMLTLGMTYCILCL